MFAAEQIYGAGHGHEKLTWVQNRLAAAGFEVATYEIEAAVYEQLNSFKAIMAPKDEPKE